MKQEEIVSSSTNTLTDSSLIGTIWKSDDPEIDGRLYKIISSTNVIKVANWSHCFGASLQPIGSIDFESLILATEEEYNELLEEVTELIKKK